jgi:hypothetical protein
MKTERISIAVPFRAQATPKGARAAREIVCRTAMPADVRVAPADAMVPAVVSRAWDFKPEAARTYYGFDGDLWLRVPDTSSNDEVLSVERAVADLASGRGYLGTMANPFLRVGERNVPMYKFVEAKPLEDLRLRVLESEDSARALPNAVRLAQDLLLCEDGYCYRRSVGPYVEVVGAEGMRLVSGEFEPPRSAVYQPFCIARLEEAAEWGATVSDLFDGTLDGDVSILDRSFLPVHDAMSVALCVGDPSYGGWIAETSEGRDAEVLLSSDAALRGMARLRGVEVATLLAGHKDRTEWPLGVEPPTPEEIVGAVDATRHHFEHHMDGFGEIRGSQLGSSYRALFERRMEATLARFDMCERGRLLPDAPHPELAIPEGPRP